MVNLLFKSKTSIKLSLFFVLALTVTMLGWLGSNFANVQSNKTGVNEESPAVSINCSGKIQSQFYTFCMLKILEGNKKKEVESYARSNTKGNYTFRLEKKQSIFGLYNSNNYAAISLDNDFSLMRLALSKAIFELVSSDTPIQKGTFVNLYSDNKFIDMYYLQEKFNSNLFTSIKDKKDNLLIFKVGRGQRKKMFKNKLSSSKIISLYKQKFPNVKRYSFEHIDVIRHFLKVVNAERGKIRDELFDLIDEENLAHFLAYNMLAGKQMNGAFYFVNVKRSNKYYLIPSFDSLAFNLGPEEKKIKSEIFKVGRLFNEYLFYTLAV